MLQFSSMHFKQWVSRLRLLVGACVVPVVVDVSVLRRLQEKGHLYIMKCSTPVNVIGSNSKKGSVERKHFQGLIPLTRLDESSNHSAAIQRTARSHIFTIYCTVEEKGAQLTLCVNWIEFLCPCCSVQVQNLLPGQRSGLVPADTLPLALQWTCCVARPAVAHGSNVSERGGRKTAGIDEWRNLQYAALETSFQIDQCKNQCISMYIRISM